MPSPRIDEASRGEALWLGTGDEATFVVLHRLSGHERPHTAVLMVPPFGWAEVCSYRDRREWAGVLAAAGMPCARLTLPGTGDSGGGPRDDGVVARWLTSIATSARWLREETHARRVAVIGLGLGGLLALAAAEEGAPIDDFVLWAVSARGTAAVREEIATGGVLHGSAADEEPQDRPEGAHEDGSLVLVGYRIDSPTAASLAEITLDPGRIAGAANARVLLLARGRLPVDSRLEAGFREAGAAVSVLTPADWSDFIVPAAGKREEPLPVIGPTVAWLHEGAPSPGPSSTPPHDAVATPVRPVPGLPGLAREGKVAPGVRERVIHLDGVLAGCFAVASEPDGGVEPVPVTAILLHSYHTGPGRLWVELARRWAARGVTAVRADLPGLHESSGAMKRQIRDRDVYEPRHIEATKALLDGLAAQGLPGRFILVGFCAGAYWAMHAALGEPRVTDLMVVNQYIMRWDDELIAERRAADTAGRVPRRAWRLIRNHELTLDSVRSGVRKVARERRAVSRSVEFRNRGVLVELLARLEGQGARTVMVFTAHEALFEQMRRAGLVARHDALPHLTIEEVPAVDHNLWSIATQAMVHARLDAALERALVPSGPVAATA